MSQLARRRARATLCGVAAALLTCVGTAPAVAQTSTPSLTGTGMISEPSNSFWGGTLTVETLSCNALTGEGHVRFHATGRVGDDNNGETAYPGTYVEEGEFFISANPAWPGSSLRTMSSFTSTFTISSADKVVTGSRTLLPGGSTEAHCGPFGTAYKRYVLGYGATRYTAEIRDADGTLLRRDAGRAVSEVQDALNASNTPENFTQRSRFHISEDPDGDGIVAASDNCPTVSNHGQANLDGDASGDACDEDIDGDGVANGDDDFPRDASESVDTDGDGTGNNADTDDDGDGASDEDDAFDLDPNEHLDTDGDTIGNNADTDDDGDGTSDDADAFPLDAGESVDTDGDGTGNNADTDDDGDGDGDDADNCQLVVNAGQGDLDGDGHGDACDADEDGDSVINDVDNCDRIASVDQTDTDVDGEGDVCDADDDNDGFADGQDNCPLHATATPERDSDGDGKGDACDGAFDSNDGVTSGGGFITNASGGKVHFSYSMLSRSGEVSGIGELRDGTKRVRLLNADGYAQTDNRSVVVGDAIVGGSTVRYRLATVDAGEPGRDDTFELEAGDKRWAGTLAGGNLQVKR